MIDAVIARLKSEVSDLSGRVEGAADFAELMRRNALPQATPAAHVLPLGLQGGQANTAAGAFVQDLRETIGVMLTFRTNDRTGSAALAKVRVHIQAVIDAICGWAPSGETGVFALTRGSLINMSAGTLVYQLEFTITDQVRILS